MADIDMTPLLLHELTLEGGWSAVVLVLPDGSQDICLIDANDPDATYRPNAPDAPHERTGPLPSAYLRRLGYECLALTRHGHQCRNIARDGSGFCHSHTERTA